MFNYKKYDKITNTYDNKHVKSVKMAMETQKIEDFWLITEKIHGANFACYVDDISIQYASRNNLLSEDESDSFYNFRSIKEEINKKMIDLYKLICDNDCKVTEIIVYGELFGGHYEHSDVLKVNQSRVQKGVQYCPDLHFKIFDIFLRYEYSENNKYMNPAYVNRICYDLEIDRVVPIFEGTLDQCLKYQNDFNSRIYLDYKLPDIGENICEGVVIKPNTPFYDYRGNRAIFKNKNDKFKEVAGERKNKVSKIVELSDDDRKQVELVDRYVTMNRLNNLESKLGELEESKQIGQFIKGLSIDVIDDLQYELNVKLEPPSRRYLSKVAKTLIMEKLYGN